VEKGKAMEGAGKEEKGEYEVAGGDLDNVEEGGVEIGFEQGKMRYVSACKRALRTSSVWLSLMTHLQGPLVRKVMSLPVPLLLLPCQPLSLICFQIGQSLQ
jgi:hypothetical protein